MTEERELPAEGGDDLDESDPCFGYEPPAGAPSIVEVRERQRAVLAKLQVRGIPGIPIDTPRLAHMVASLREVLIERGIVSSAELEYRIARNAMDVLEQAEAESRPSGRALKRAEGREEIRRFGRRLDG